MTTEAPRKPPQPNQYRLAEEPHPHAISCRLTRAQYSSLVPFLECFGSTSDALRWLLEHDVVREVMATAIAGQVVTA